MPKLKIRAQVLSALNAINEAILKVKSPEQLYKAVCAAAVNEAGFRTAAILVPDQKQALPAI